MTEPPAPVADAPIRLWGIGTGRTLRPIWTLLELGLRPDVDFAIEPILTRSPAMETPEFRAVSPRGKIPMLDHGALRIGESTAISLHLADAFRDRIALTPAPGSLERVRHDELCWFAMVEMDAILYTIRRHEGLPEVYGASPVAVDAARAYFQRASEEIGRHLADGRPHLLGEAFTVADLIVKTCLDWAAMLDPVPLDASDASLQAYSARLSERPAFREAMRVNFPPEARAALGI